jgi:hypothetical protein
MRMEFKKAERKKAWLKLAYTGPSGSGKTYSALLVAKGMGGRIAVVDTENESAQLYAGLPEMPEFDHLSIDPPYTIEKYTAAIKLALDQGYENLIIDSLSHAWAGEGGLLDQKEALDARGGKGEKNKFANWGAITKQQEHFKAWLLKADIHLQVTMRSKQDYVLTEGNKPVKVGLAPVQREGMEYEFTTVFDLAMNHSAQASKDRTGLFDSKVFVPSEETGKALIAWLNGGAGERERKPSSAIDEAAKRDHSPNHSQKNTAGGGGKSGSSPPPAPTADDERAVALGFASHAAQREAWALLNTTIRGSGLAPLAAQKYAVDTFQKAEIIRLTSAEIQTFLRYLDGLNTPPPHAMETTGFAEPAGPLPFEPGGSA